MSDLCFQASIGAYIMIAAVGLGAGAIAAATLAVSIREWLMHRAAIAIEARRAGTPQSGSVHEGAGPQDIAQ